MNISMRKSLLILVVLLLIVVAVIYIRPVERNKRIIITTTKELMPVIGNEKTVILLLEDDRFGNEHDYDVNVSDVFSRCGDIRAFDTYEEWSVDQDNVTLKHIASVDKIEHNSTKGMYHVHCEGVMYSSEELEIVSLPIIHSDNRSLLKEIRLEIPYTSLEPIEGNYTIVDDTLVYDVYFEDTYSKTEGTSIEMMSVVIVSNIDSKLDGVAMMSHILDSFVRHMNGFTSLSKNQVKMMAGSRTYIENNCIESRICSVAPE